MNLPPLPLIDRCLFIDNSMLELLNTCPRALQYNRLNQRILAAESPSLNFGSAIHLGLEFRYKTCANLPSDPFNESELNKIMTRHFDEHPCPVEDYRNLNWAMEVLKQYNRIHGQEDFQLLEYEQPKDCSYCEGKGEWTKENPDAGLQIGPEDHEIEPMKLYQTCPFCSGTGKNKLMVELPFALPLFAFDTVKQEVHGDWGGSLPSLGPDEIGVFYSGRIDLPVLRDDNQIFVIDHKTTSILGPTFFDDKKMSAQQKGYAWSFQRLTGMKVRGYEVNAIRVKEPPQYVTNGTEPRKGGKRQTLEGWWSESIVRERFLLNEGELDEWYENVIELISEFFWRYSRNYFPMKTNWCVGKYGRCSYFDVCSTYPKEDRNLILNSGLYQDNLWSPLKQPSQSRQK